MKFAMNIENTFMFTKRTIIFKILLLTLAFGSLLSCEKIDDLVEHPLSSFDTDYYGMDFLVEANDIVGWHIFAEDSIENDISIILSQLGFSEDQVESVILKEAQVSLTESDNITDFNMMGTLELTVYTELQGETKIAWSEPVPTDQSEFAFDVTEEDVLPYFREDNFILTAQGHLKQRINENVKLHAKVKFRIKARL